MADDRKPQPADTSSNEVERNRSGDAPDPKESARDGKPSDGAPYDKDAEPAEQPS